MIVPDDQITTREVTGWHGLHLINFHSSSCSQKVRILLREKGLAWTSHPVDLAREQHVSPWFLGINSRGVVPILVHDGVVHVESNDILEYLDALPSSAESFFPKDDAERRRVKESLDLEDSLHTDLRNITMGFLMPKTLAQKSAKTLARWEREGRDDPKRAHEVTWWRDYAARGIPAETAQASVDVHRRAFEDLDRDLGDSRWLLGDRPSVLDIAWFITVLRLQSAGYPLERHRNLLRWFEHVSSRPSFVEETSPPAPLRAALRAYALYRRLTGTTLPDITR